MEHLWSPVVATGGSRSRIATPQRPQKHAKTAAVGCDQLPDRLSSTSRRSHFSRTENSNIIRSTASASSASPESARQRNRLEVVPLPHDHRDDDWPLDRAAGRDDHVLVDPTQLEELDGALACPRPAGLIFVWCERPFEGTEDGPSGRCQRRASGMAVYPIRAGWLALCVLRIDNIPRVRDGYIRSCTRGHARARRYRL